MKMAEQERDPLLIAPCGMDCMVCYRHCACKKPCEGCRSSGQNKPGHCRKCEIKNCAAEKGLVYCAECPGYPCRKLENLENILNDSPFFEVFDYDFPRIRRLFSKKDISATDLKMILPLTESLLACAEDGLKSRGFGEEVYLAPLREKLDKLNKSFA